MSARRRFWTWVIVVAVALCAAVAIARWPKPYTFVIRNAGTVVLEDVEVHMAGGEVSTGPLAPGGIATVTLRSYAATGLVVFIREGSGFHASAFHDVTIGPRTDLVVDVDRRVSFDRRPVA